MIVLVRLKLGAHAEAVDAEIEVVADGTFYKRLPGDISMAIIARVLNLHTNVDKRNEEKLIKASEILVKANSNKSSDIPTKPKKKVVIPHVSDDDETDEEVIIIKSKPKPKKKVKKIIIEDSSDSDNSIDSDDSKEYNKKSYNKSSRKHQPVSIQREVERPKPIFNSANFFI